MGRRGVQRQSRACAQAGPLSPRASQCGLFDWQSHAVPWNSGLPQQCSRHASCRTRMLSSLLLQSLSIPVWGSDDGRLSRHQLAHSSTLCQIYGCISFPLPLMMLRRDSRHDDRHHMAILLGSFCTPCPIAHFAAKVNCIDRWHIVHAFARHASKCAQADCSPLGEHRVAGRPQSPLLQQEALHQPPAQPLRARLRLLQPLLPATAHLLSQHQLANRMRPQQPAVPRQ